MFCVRRREAGDGDCEGGEFVEGRELDELRRVVRKRVLEERKRCVVVGVRNLIERYRAGLERVVEKSRVGMLMREEFRLGIPTLG